MNNLWLFDFDGTLVDSAKAIKKCYLRITDELAPERKKFVEGMLIGPTLEESSKMILTNKKIHLLDKFKNLFQKMYDEIILFETKKYPFVNSTLIHLHKNGDDLCIVTNKRSNPTLKLIDYYGWGHLFKWVACIDNYPEAKNKSDLIKLQKINKKKYKEIFMVGDTVGDAIAAKNNEIKFIKACYGYGSKELWTIKSDANIERFSDLKKIF